MSGLLIIIFIVCVLAVAGMAWIRLEWEKRNAWMEGYSAGARDAGRYRDWCETDMTTPSPKSTPSPYWRNK